MGANYGYRFEYGGRVAVFSSDTRYNHNVIKYGAGADLLVHEVASARPELMKEAYQRIIGHHTTPRKAGLVFAQTKPTPIRISFSSAASVFLADDRRYCR